MDFTVEFEPTLDEVTSTVAGNGRKGRRNLWINVVWMFAGAIVAGGFGQWTIAAILIVCGGFCLLMVRMMPNASAAIAAKACQLTTLHVAGDRFTYVRGSEQGQGMWPLTRVIVGPIAYTLVISNNVAVLIPRRVLSEEQAAALDGVIGGLERKLVKVV